MMENKYVLTIDDLVESCKESKVVLPTTGKCSKKCPEYRKCLHLCKEQTIHSLIHMNENETRFPGLLRFIQNRPEMLWYIPAGIYKRAYGMYQQALPCQRSAGVTLLSHIDQIQETLGLLDDDVSRQTLLNVLMYRLTQNGDYIHRALSMEPQYLIKPFRRLGSDEVYVDCGAFNGDSFISYCSLNKPPKSAYLFEPDEENRKQMRENTSLYSSKTNIKIIDKGVHQYTGSLFFAGGKGMGGHFSRTDEPGSKRLKVTSIDDEIQEEISFIKMDIEGSEQDALMGAKNHILSTYPKLAVCIYHSTKDLWEIPLLIRNSFPEYEHFCIRHHSESFFETVLYVYR